MAEARWSVKVIQWINNSRFRVTWANGEVTEEPQEMLDNVDQVCIRRAKEKAPYPIIVTFSYVQRTCKDTFKVWINKRITVSGLKVSQIPLCEDEIQNISHNKKTAFCGHSPTEKPENGSIASSIARPVRGGCFQESLSKFLEKHGLQFQDSSLQKIITDHEYTDLREVKHICEERNLPFRISKLKKKVKDSGHFLKIVDDHCEYMDTLTDLQGSHSEIWTLEMVKRTKKRMRNWTVTQE
jgi:hypothetical protein